jgi:hypothetical protein
MTTEERFERIEHYTANSAEERRKDREEYKMLRRDTQRQIGELATLTTRLGVRIDQMGDRIDELGNRIEQQGNEFRAADALLAKRIESMVSAIGEFISRR